jgi:hypothetical protein
MTLLMPEFWLIWGAVAASTVFAIYRTRPRRHYANVPMPQVCSVCARQTYPFEVAEEEMPENLYVQGVLPLQEREHPELVKRLRAKARELAAGGREITSDDVHEAHPIPSGIDPRIMGAVFHPRSDWVRVGSQQSRRKENHGRWITRWSLRCEDNE